MRRRGEGAALALIAVAALTACGKPRPPAKTTCRAPIVEVKANPTPVEAARLAASNCIKRAAFDRVRQGGPVEAAAQGAIADCADTQTRFVQALARMPPSAHASRPDDVGEQLLHLARMTAFQKRSRGCGRPGGEPETLMTTGSR